MTAKLIRFTGNPRPRIRHGGYPTVIILPVIRIERYVDHDDEPVRKLDRRKRRRAPSR